MKRVNVSISCLYFIPLLLLMFFRMPSTAVAMFIPYCLPFNNMFTLLTRIMSKLSNIYDVIVYDYDKNYGQPYICWLGKKA